VGSESVVAIVQARMGSERLPGKVLLDIAGQSMLERVVVRLRMAPSIDRVVIATTENPADDAIVTACDTLDVLVIRGSEDDVIGRFARVARAIEPDVCVRVSADSPFVDAEVCDLVVTGFLEADPPVDYASNKLEPSFPLGLDVEAFSRDALMRADEDAREPFERAHVTPHIYMHPESFRLLPVRSDSDLHAWRWTVDTAEDLAFAREVFARFGGRNDFSWREVVQLIDAEPRLAEINRHITGKPLRDG
jgi:spore coat polysaccharide biosynthesis protein SpsF